MGHETINPLELRKGDFFSVIAAEGSVHHKNGDRSFNAKVFKLIDVKTLNPEKTILFGLAYTYQYEDGEMVLKPYNLFRDESYVVSLEHDEWRFYPVTNTNTI